MYTLPNRVWDTAEVEGTRTLRFELPRRDKRYICQVYGILESLVSPVHRV